MEGLGDCGTTLWLVSGSDLLVRGSALCSHESSTGALSLVSVESIEPWGQCQIEG
jgi:hypothetical protein